jgi:hypothetical protein
MTNTYLRARWLACPRPSRALAGLLLALPVLSQAQGLAVTAASPAANATAAPRNSAATVTFNQALTAGSASAFNLFSSQRGGLRTVATPATVSGNTLTFSPSAYDFLPGETLLGTVTTAAQGSGGTLAAPYVYQFTAATTPGPGTFGVPTSYPIGQTTNNLTLGDVNGDGLLDLVAVNNSSNSISVLLGQGGGTLGPKMDYTTAFNPSSVALGDVNGDGRLDIVTANTSNSVSVLLAQAGGGFAPRVDYAILGTPNDVALGDVNGDGQLDLVTSNPNFNTVSVLLGQGGGTFGSKRDYNSRNFPTGVQLGDLNGDGRLDIVSANSANGFNTVTVHFGQAGGLFGPEIDYLAGTNPTDVALGDVNGDGRLDIVTVSNGAGIASVLLGQAGGSFMARTDYPTGANPGRVTLGDVNGDGRLDIVTANFSNTTSVLLGQHNGGFGPKVDYPVGTAVYGVALGDVNGDGRLDIATANAGASTVSVLLANAAPASLTSFAPASGVVGTSIVLTGSGFIGTTAVTFNGTRAFSYVVNSDVQLTVVVPPGATTGPIALATPSGTATSATPFTVVPSATTAWLGAVGSDWYEPRNWTAGVPTATVDALIPVVGTAYPVLVNGTANVRGLTLAPGASLTQVGGTLVLTGDLAANGTLTATGGLVATNGSARQVLGGTSVLALQNLTIGAAGATLGTATSLRQVLTLLGDLATGGQPLTLRSSASGGAATDALVVNNGGVVLGTATVQRAIDPSVNPGLGYRHLSTPMSTSTVGDLATSTFTPVVNPLYNSAAVPDLVKPYPTVFGYDDSRLALANNTRGFDKGFFSPATLTDPLVVGRGYAVNIAANQVVTFRGTLTNGDQTLALSSLRPSNVDGGWQLLGNPYPAPLAYSLVAPADRAGLEAAIYVYSSTSQYVGRYRSYVNGIGDPVLPIGQGFFARVAAGLSSASITFRNSQRLTTPSATALQRPTADPRPLLQLTLAGSGALLDEATVYFEQGATSGFDAAFDAEKLVNPTGLNLSIGLGSSRQLSIDGQPELGSTQRVLPLAIGVPAAGVYTFTASQLLNLSTVPVYLRDLLTGAVVDLRQQPTYQFAVGNAAALNTTRFELVFSPQQVLAAVPAALAQQVAVYPNPANAQVTIALPAGLSRGPVTAALFDGLGRLVQQQVLPAGTATHRLPLATVLPGVYSLRLTTEQGILVKKLVID